MNEIEKCFPLPVIREKQRKALDFIQRSIDKGYKDILISAPTGAGKSGIGHALCNWAGTLKDTDKHRKGGYYLITQKLLQDQLEKDTERYLEGLNKCVTLKTAAEYPCTGYGNCKIGRSVENSKCPKSICAYALKKQKFLEVPVSITNYPYFFTESTYVGELPARKVLICDECHTLEDQIIGFMDLELTQDAYEDQFPGESLPRVRTRDEFVDWIEDHLIPDMAQRLKELEDLYGKKANLSAADAAVISSAENFYSKLGRIVETIYEDIEWVFWYEQDKKGYKYYLRPLSAAPFFKGLVQDRAEVRVYMSATPGTKDVFCRALGLDSDDVACLTLGSSFPLENRPVIVAPLASLSKANQERNLPAFISVTKKLASKPDHAQEKGIIHCHSYALGDAVYDALQGTEVGDRIIYPRNSDERLEAFERHCTTKRPSIILSPSFVEGFDFKDDRARWQVIFKVPFPSLGDKRVARMLDIDEDWYLNKTCIGIIQGAGRIVRSDEDYGVTYIFDADFVTVRSRAKRLIPKWFMRSLQDAKKKRG